MEKQEVRKRQRVVLVPCPFQGHISPMLDLGTALHSKGFSITIAHTTFNSPDISNHHDFTFLPLADNLSEHNTFPGNLLAFLKTINNNCEAPLRKCLAEMIEQHGPHDQVVCIIHDTLMYYSAAVANHMKIPSIVLYTNSAASVQAYFAIPPLQAEGHIPLKDSMLRDIVPGLQPLRFKDLPLHNSELEDLLQIVSIVRNVKTSSGIIWNTVDDLESSSMSQLQQYYQLPFFSVGPLHKMAPSSSNSLLKEDYSCIQWLDKQAPNSVIYISLGSLATMDHKELTEMAWGLANCGQPVLWVVRPNSVGDSEWVELLPEGFQEATGERVHIIKWAPQKEVLAHSAVGGFWSHCGWNSTLESISEGVPVICRPYFGDQYVDARYISHVWRVGLQMEHDLERGEIEKAIRTLMLDKEGEEMRQRATYMKEKIKLCTMKGGSSYNSLNDLEEFISSLQLPK
ncbi:hypothetical protein LguiA_012040 [Lonicera macranthoides]